jgi:hypothetical protein
MRQRRLFALLTSGARPIRLKPQEKQLHHVRPTNWPIFVVIRNRLIRNLTTNGAMVDELSGAQPHRSRIWTQVIASAIKGYMRSAEAEALFPSFPPFQNIGS